MRKNPGRPIKQPTGDRSTLTLKISAEDKRKMIAGAQGYGMTLTEYILMLVNRDS
jgi:hypothetical protein